MVVTEHILTGSGEAERLGRKPQTFGSGSSGYLGCGWNSVSCHCMKLTGAHLPSQRRLPSSQLVPSPVRQDQQNPRQLHAPYILLMSTLARSSCMSGKAHRRRYRLEHCFINTVAWQLANGFQDEDGVFLVFLLFFY